jgi:ferric-dicitrate binding protein FerR (iron transport regulator)
MINEKFSEIIDERKSMEFDKEVEAALSTISQIDKIEVDEAYTNVQERIRKNSRLSRILNQIQRVAAILFIPLLIGSLWYTVFNNKAEKNFTTSTYSTKSPIGMRSVLTLPDSSIVWLNSGSTITYSIPFTKTNRRVTINGEAYFEVSKIHGSSFYVKSANLEVKVVGTKFNFKAYNDEKKTEVVLEEGKVELYSSLARGEDKVVMEPGTRAIVDNADRRIILNSENTERFTSWRKGLMIFDNTPFVEVAKQLERWYGTEIIVKDPAIYKYKITTKFKDETLKDVLEMLEISSPIKIKYKPNVLDPKTNQIKIKSRIIIEKKN